MAIRVASGALPGYGLRPGVFELKRLESQGSLILRAGIFLIFMPLFFWIEPWGRLIEDVLVPWCEYETRAAFALMQFFGSDVIRSGAELRDPQTQKGIVVLWACSGADATGILLAAIWIYPSCHRARWLGMVLGFLLIQGINILRIISLFYLNLLSETWFQFAHLYLWQGLLMIDVLLFMLVWLRWQEGMCRAL